MSSTAEAEILDLEQRRLRAITTGELTGLADMFAENFLQVHANGRVDDKAGNLARENGTPRRIDPRDPTVRILGDVAILTGEMIYRVGEGEAEVANRLYVTQVVTKEADGQWRFVSVQATKVVPA